MNFGQLKSKFEEKAAAISNPSDHTSKFRAVAYTRVANKIEAEHTDSTLLVTKEQIQDLDISDYMKQRAVEFLEGKEIKTAVKSPSNKRTTHKTTVISPTLIKDLSEFMGLGQEKAKKLIKAGITHVNQLRLKKYKALLPEETKLFIDLKPTQKIPHEHIKLLEPHLMKASDKKMKLVITGSYRRKKPFSSDIDVMVVSNNEDAVNALLKKLNKILNGKVYPYSKGKDKMSLLVNMSEFFKDESDADHGDENNAEPSKLPNNYIYKIDVFRTSSIDAVAMLLYSTGSKEFNITMRAKAKKLGYLLNQKGLFKNGERVPDLKKEKDYFDILKMDYKDPKARV